MTPTTLSHLSHTEASCLKSALAFLVLRHRIQSSFENDSDNSGVDSSKSRKEDCASGDRPSLLRALISECSNNDENHDHSVLESCAMSPFSSGNVSKKTKHHILALLKSAVHLALPSIILHPETEASGENYNGEKKINPLVYRIPHIIGVTCTAAVEGICEHIAASFRSMLSSVVVVASNNNNHHHHGADVNDENIDELQKRHDIISQVIVELLVDGLLGQIIEQKHGTAAAVSVILAACQILHCICHHDATIVPEALRAVSGEIYKIYYNCGYACACDDGDDEPHRAVDFSQALVHEYIYDLSNIKIVNLLLLLEALANIWMEHHNMVDSNAAASEIVRIIQDDLGELLNPIPLCNLAHFAWTESSSMGGNTNRPAVQNHQQNNWGGLSLGAKIMVRLELFDLIQTVSNK